MSTPGSCTGHERCAPACAECGRSCPPASLCAGGPTIDHNGSGPDPPVGFGSTHPSCQRLPAQRPFYLRPPQNSEQTRRKTEESTQLLVMVGHVNRGPVSQCTCDSESASVIGPARLPSARGRWRLRFSPVHSGRQPSPRAALPSRLGRWKKPEKPEEKSPDGANSRYQWDGSIAALARGPRPVGVAKTARPLAARGRREPRSCLTREAGSCESQRGWC